MNLDDLQGIEQMPIASGEESQGQVTPTPQASAEVQPEPQTEQVQREPAKAEALSGVAKWLEENVAIPLIDNLDSSRDAEQVAADRAQSRDEVAELDQQVQDNPTALSETGTAYLGGLAGVVESGVNFLDFTGDAIKQQFIEEDESENVLSSDYESSEFTLGIAENKTAVGNFARQSLTMLGLMRGARLGGVTLGTGANASAGARLGGEAIRGAIADLILDQEGENLSNIIAEANPALRESAVAAMAIDAAGVLAIDEDDSLVEQKLKNMIEGGIFGLAVDGVGELFGAIRAGKKALRDSESIEEAVDAAIKEAQSPSRVEPGKEVREAEAKANNAKDLDSSLYEPNERAASTTSYNIEDVAKSQEQFTAAGSPANGGTKSHMTSDIYKEILSSKGATEGLQVVIKRAAEGADIQKLLKRAADSNNDQLVRSLPILDEFLGANKDILKETDFTALSKKMQDGEDGLLPAYRTIEGGIVTRALIVDTAQQIREISLSAQGVDLINGDSFRQSEMLIDRLRTLLRFDKTASIEYGRKLQSRKGVPFNLEKTLAESEGEAAMRIRKSDEKLDEMLGLLRQGDPEAKVQFQTMTDALVMADGDAGKMLDFWELFQKGTGKNVQNAMYNGYLSSPKSQLRNLVGNSINVVMRPLAQSIGYGVGSTESRVALSAFHAFGENLKETWRIAKLSYAASSVEGNIGQATKFDAQTGNTLQIIQQLKKQAQSPGEKAAAGFAELQYNFFSNPWMRMPTRALGAADDAVRTLVARMELNKDAMRNSIETGNGFKVNKDRYAKLVDLKIGTKGEILDQKLLDAAKDVTFQRDLQFFGQDLMEMSKKYPVMKYFLPFVKTPTNILINTASFMPGWTRIPGSSKIPIVGQFATEYRAVMKSNDADQIALYKGREAIGMMTATSAVGLALTGNLTGNGPQDKEKRELWLRNNQPNSIKIPGVGLVSYQAIEPLNTIFSMAADLSQLAMAGEQSAYDRSFAQFAYTMSAAVTSKSYFEGLQSAAELIDISNPRWGYIAKREAAGLANTFTIPLAGARRALGNALAPGKQEFDEELNKALAAAFPGYANVYGVNRIDIFTGKEIGADLVKTIFNAFIPFEVGPEGSPVAQKLTEAGVDINISASETIKGIELTAEQRVQFDRYVYESGLGENLTSLMKREWWDKDYKAWQQSGRVFDPKAPWADAILDEFAAAKKYARNKMARFDPDLGAAMQAKGLIDRAVQTGSYDRANELTEFAKPL